MNKKDTEITSERSTLTEFSTYHESSYDWPFVVIHATEH